MFKIIFTIVIDFRFFKFTQFDFKIKSLYSSNEQGSKEFDFIIIRKKKQNETKNYCFFCDDARCTG